MQHKVTVENLNRSFLSNQNNASLEDDLKKTVNNFLKPLVEQSNPKIDYTIQIGALDSDNPIVMLTLKLQRESKNISIGEAKLIFSRSFKKHNVAATCSNFVVAKLITTPSASITEYELAFLRFENSAKAFNEAKNSVPNNEEEETFFKKTSIVGTLVSLGEWTLESTSEEKDEKKLRSKAKILRNLTKFLILYNNGEKPILEDITNFRAIIDELKNTDSSYKTNRILNWIGRGVSIVFLLSIVALIALSSIFSHTVGPIAGLIFLVSFAIGGPEIFVGLAALFLYALGITKCESSVDRLYSLANEMQADKTLEDQAKSSAQEESKKEQAKNPSQQNLFLTDSSSREERTTNLTQPNAAITGPPH